MRIPVAAGTFYPFDESSLRNLLKRMIDKAGAAAPATADATASDAASPIRPRDTFGFVSPHAGYIYSGWAAAYGYKSAKNLAECDTVVIIGPNHTGIGAPVSVSFDDWATPMGKMYTDKELAKQIIDGFVVPDETAHKYEHSVEVQLPFIQYFNPNAKIVCIVMMDQSPMAARYLAKRIADAADALKRDIIVIASSDFTHYEPADIASRKDNLLIEKITQLDVEGMYETVMGHSISACGYGTMAALVEYSRLRGCRKGTLLKYSNSGEASGDYSQVVGYASISMFKENKTGGKTVGKQERTKKGEKNGKAKSAKVRKTAKGKK